MELLLWYALTGLFALSATLGVVAVYRLYFHPCAKFPGPKLWAITRLPLGINFYRGNLHHRILELHDKYGPVVRVAPFEISFITAEAWNDIYGKQGNKPQLMKDHLSFLRAPGENHDLLFEPDPVEHGRMRRNFSHAFSEKSLRDQEPILVENIKKFVTRLRDICDQPVDLSNWFNFVTFDIMGYLTFGDNFQCLDTGDLHPWVHNLFTWVSAAAMLGVTQRFWPLSHILMLLVPKSMRVAERFHRAMTKEKLDKRLANPNPRPDFISAVQKFVDRPYGLLYDEVFNTCSIFMVGGSETTATVLTGVLHGLLSAPDAYSRMTKEIRSTFKSSDEINLVSVTKMEYISAAIYEGLRLLPPTPGNLRRVTPPEGSHVSGWDVPGNTLVAVDCWAAFRSPANFYLPDRFAPERWLPEPPADFANDNLKVMQGFSVGPRNCIGKNLALMEMKMILASLLFHFDVAFLPETVNYTKELKVWGFYKRGPFLVKLTPITA